MENIKTRKFESGRVLSRREKNTMNKSTDAANKFKDGCACSQAILCTYGEEYGIDHLTALRISSGFAGGMRVGETCGAITGAIMVIGLKCCSAGCNKIEGRKRAYSGITEFYARFLEIHKSLLCKDLLGVDLSMPEGMAAAESKGLFRTLCPVFVKDAGEVLEKLLDKI
jgi:C_GCAxxG_C_C family probable redox protein